LVLFLLLQKVVHKAKQLILTLFKTIQAILQK